MGKRTYSINPLFMQIGLVVVVAILIGGFAVTPGYGQAQSNTVRFTTDFESEGIPFCGSEQIFITGTVNMVFHETIRPNGESIFTSHLNYMKTNAVSASGEEFIVKETQNMHTKVPTIQTGVNEFSSVIHGIIIDKGQGINGPNSQIQIILHTVIHPNGEITGEVDKLEIKCEGGSDESFVVDLLENIL